MAETLKTIWVVERRTDVSDWVPNSFARTREDARRWASYDNAESRNSNIPYTYRVAKYVRARA